MSLRKFFLVALPFGLDCFTLIGAEAAPLGTPPQPVITIFSSAGASQTAPFTVHVHAKSSLNITNSASDLNGWHKSRFQWNFGDTVSPMSINVATETDATKAPFPPRNQAVNLATEQEGFNAAYTYQSPGTYTITLSVTDEHGVLRSTSTQIVIGADTRASRTFYVDPMRPDNSGNGTSEATAWKDLSYAITTLNNTSGAGPARLLLRRGPTHILAGASITAPNLVIEGYSTGTGKPIVQLNGTITITATNTFIKGLIFRTTSSGREAILLSPASRFQTISDCEFDGPQGGFTSFDKGILARGKTAFIVSNRFDVTDAYTIIPGGGGSNTSDVVIAGNIMLGSQTEHAVRLMPPGAARLNFAFNWTNKYNRDKAELRIQRGSDVTVLKDYFLSTGAHPVVQVCFDSGYESGTPIEENGARHIVFDSNIFRVGQGGIAFEPNSRYVMLRNNSIIATIGSALSVGISESDGGTHSCDPGGNNTSPISNMADREAMAVVQNIDIVGNTFSPNVTQLRAPGDGTTNVGPPFEPPPGCKAIGIPINVCNIRFENNPPAQPCPPTGGGPSNVPPAAPRNLRVTP